MGRKGPRSPVVPVVFRCDVLDDDGEVLQQVARRIDFVDEHGAGKGGDDRFEFRFALDDVRGIRHEVSAEIPTEVPVGSYVEVSDSFTARFPPRKVILRDTAGRVAGMEERWFV